MQSYKYFIKFADMNRAFIVIIISLCLAGCNYGGIPDTDTHPDENTGPIVERITIAAVTDYSPAPGQFVNLLPPASPGETLDEIKTKVADYLNRGYAVTLGSFGGSITVRLSEPVMHHPEKPDFFVAGNAITNGSEPGIVEVSTDGIKWYQLKGEFSPHDLPMIHITYNKEPDSNDIPYSAVTDAGSTITGSVAWLPQYRSQSYWPVWIPTQELSFSALRLPDNAKLNESTGQYDFTPYSGYADSYPNSSPLGYLSLDDAIDPATGTKAELTSISFVRVTTSILQSNGPLGEASTEVSGIYVLL